MATGKGTINEVRLLGRLGADPEIRYSTSGRACASFNLATNRTWKDKDGNRQEKTDWHRVVAWGKIAEVMGQYLVKGSPVYIIGHNETREYQDAQGQKKYITEVIVEAMELMGGKPNGQGGVPAPAGPGGHDEDGLGYPDDDLPF